MYKIGMITTLFISLLYYSFSYEPNNLVISQHYKTYNLGKNNIKIAHITDLHTKGLNTVEKKLINALQLEKPDIIFITGDLATPNGTYQGYDDVLSKLSAPKGVYFVPGNWEYWQPIENLDSLLKRNNIINLKNSIKELNNHLSIIGFDDIEGEPDTKLFEMLKSNILNISLFHSPSFFKEIPNTIKLSFAGHSHGGQIKVPFFGALWTPRGTGKYVEGWYKNKNNSELFVSRGIGNSILPIRFNCRPELAIINLKY